MARKTLALIPVRGGSKSIPGKNIRVLAGRPLLHHTLDAALRAERIDEVWVSSDSERILEVARELDHPKLRLDLRRAELATDTASTESVMLDIAERDDFEHMVLIQATSPLTTSAELDAALGVFAERRADSLVTVTQEHRFRWSGNANGFASPQNYEPASRPRRQDWAGDEFENGAFYVSTRSLLLQTRSRLHGNIVSFVMNRMSSIELDTPEDWALMEALLLARTAATSGAFDSDRGHDGGATPDFERIRLLVSDVDGVLTDGGMYYGPSGEALKKFNTKDGLGIRKWLESGREFAVITGEDSPSVHERMKKLGVKHYFPGVKDKGRVLSELCKQLAIAREEVIYVGDDENDLSVLEEVGRFICPADAADAVKQRAHWATQRRGGEGCVREVVELMLKADAN